MSNFPDPRRTEPGGRKPADAGARVRSVAVFVGLGMQLAGSMIFFIAVGYFLDRRFGTSPWLFLGGAILGAVAFMVQIFRVAKSLQKPKKGAQEPPQHRSRP